MLNIRYRRHGGMAFLKVGRLNLSWSLSPSFEASQTAAKREARKARQQARIDRAFIQGMSIGRRYS